MWEQAVTAEATGQRARRLLAAVGFALVPPDHPELQVLHRWADNWRAGQANSIVGGTTWEPTAWRAVQRAAWHARVIRQ